MDVQVLLYPHSTAMAQVRTHSKRIVHEFEKYGITLAEKRWNGTFKGLPPDTNPSLVHFSYDSGRDLKVLAYLCHRRGHILFFQGGVMNGEGIFDSSPGKVTTSVDQFVGRLRKHGRM